MQAWSRSAPIEPRPRSIFVFNVSVLRPFQGGVHSGPKHISHLIELARRAGPGGAMIVVDHPCNVAERAHAVARLEHLADVLIGYGAGYIRIGVARATGVLDLAAGSGEEPRGGACLMTAN